MFSKKQDFLSQLLKLENLKQVKIFFASYIIVLISYGTKLIGNAYPHDDYYRFYSTEEWYQQADRGRWFTSILNNLFFNEGFFVLPYFNSILSLFFIALSGFFVSKIWNLKNSLIVGFVILIVTISPFWSNNLLFSSNITVSIGMLLGVFGYYFLSKKKNILIAITLLVFSFGVYQTVFQSIIIISLALFTFDIIKINTVKELKKTIKKHIIYLVWIFCSYIISHIISEIIIKFNDIENLYEAYNQVTKGTRPSFIFNNLITVFTSPVEFAGNLFAGNTSLGTLTLLIFILGIFAYLKKIVIKKDAVKFKIMLLFFAILFSMVIVIQIPKLLGVLMPIRACFHFSFFIAFLFVSLVHYKNIFINNSLLITTSIYILVSIGYISKFYDVANRQTSSDINRANIIVNRIRLHPNFNFTNKNTPWFYIIGTKKFTVTNGPQKKQEEIEHANTEYQALNSLWSKYKIFKHFTDFDFKKVTTKKANKIYNKIKKENMLTGEYPEKNSILFVDDVVVLILDIDDNRHFY